MASAMPGEVAEVGRAVPERVTVALAAGLFVDMAGLALVAFPEHVPVREPARRRT